MFYTYILKSTIFSTFYVGCCGDIEQRVKLHNTGKVRSTKHKQPWILFHSEEFATRAEARKRELYLKSLKKRKSLENLIKHF